ncbi:MAG: ferritin-like domain-containing protein, partial [Ensifer adhaerens]
MSLLKAEPPGAVKSLEELFAIAFAMEREAATRYDEIAKRMRREGNPELAAVFDRLVADENGHLDSVARWSQQRSGHPPDAARIRWQIPETFDDENAGTIDPRLLNAYRILSMAVRNEERAFAFWSYVAAHADSEDIRKAAESLAHEELGHVALLRRERRKAFHADLAVRRTHPRNGASEVSEAAPLERHLANLLDTMASSGNSEASAFLRDLAREARQLAGELDDASIVISTGNIPLAAQGAASAVAEFLTDRYLEAADSVSDDEK